MAGNKARIVERIEMRDEGKENVGKEYDGRKAYDVFERDGASTSRET